MTTIVEQKQDQFEKTMRSIAFHEKWAYQMFTRHTMAAMQKAAINDAFMARIHRECSMDYYADILAYAALDRDMQSMWREMVLH